MNQEKRYEYMTQTKIPRLLGELSLPAILSMLVTNIYNLVDTAFVGSLGTSASGATGVVFGYMAIVQSVGFMCGQGAGSITARLLGGKDRDTAGRYASTAFFMSFSLAFIIGFVSYLMLDELVFALGSTVTIAPYAKNYIFFIILAAPFLSSSMTLNNLLRYEGLARLGTVGLLTGAVLNIGLDALLMFGFKLGITGAGLATGISQVISWGVLLSMFLCKKTQCRLSLKLVYPEPVRYWHIVTTGFPSLIRQALGSISTIMMNGYSCAYGDAAIAAMSIVSRTSFFVLSVTLGVGQGYQPVASFNFGAKKYSRVKEAYDCAFRIAEILLLVIAVPVFINARPIVRLFRDDPQVIEYAQRGLRLSILSLVLLPHSVMTEMGFQSTGRRLHASVMSSSRGGLVFIPVLMLLSALRGYAGVQEAQPATFFITFVIDLFYSRVFLNMLRKREETGI